jgi:type IV secretory pathway VirB2 component (pilin)
MFSLEVVDRRQKEARVKKFPISPSVVSLLVVPLTLSAAHAAPGLGGPLVNFGQSILEFLTGTIGPTVVGIGLAVAAFSLIFGSREGFLKAAWAIVGGAMLFGVGSIVDYLIRIAQ